MLFEFFLHPTYLAAGGGVFCLGWLLYQIFKPSNQPNLPIIGVRQREWFAIWRAAWRNTWNLKAAEHAMYTKYTSKGQAAILPLLTSTYVILPPSDAKFIADAPDSQVNMHLNLNDVFQFKYTVMDEDIIHRPLQGHIIVTTLTKEIGNLVPDMLDEASRTFERVWGTSHAWREINVYESTRHIIGSVSNRIFFGAPICRDPALVEVGMAYAQHVPQAALSIRLVTPVIRPLIAPFMTLRARYNTYKFRSITKPTIERRLKEFDARQSDPEAHKVLGSVPNDFLEWSIKQAKDTAEPALSSPAKLADRLLVLNFVSIHTTTFALVNVVLDLVCFNSPEVIGELRTEISSVLSEHGGHWNKRSLANMYKLDSLLRESMRLHSAGAASLGRKVAAKEGIDTPSGTHLPYLTNVMVDSYSYTRDKNIFGEDADQFRPFRFAEQRSDQSAQYVERARKAFPTTSPDFLAFGHGRNACPGRFFAASELKLVVGSVLLPCW